MAISNLFDSNCKVYFNEVGSIKNYHGQKGEKHNESNDEEDGNEKQPEPTDGDSFETSVCILKVFA